MTGIIERVAQAIYASRNGAGRTPWAHLPESHQEPYLKDAKAALTALRGPTEEMVKAGYVAIEDTDIADNNPDDDLYEWGKEWEPNAIAAWGAMIDAALGEAT